MTQSPSLLRVLAHPQPTHRERYTSELDPNRNRPQRFLRTASNPNNFEHPTVEVQWLVIRRFLYLVSFCRLDILTMESEQKILYSYYTSHCTE